MPFLVFFSSVSSKKISNNLEKVTKYIAVGLKSLKENKNPTNNILVKNMTNILFGLLTNEK